MNREGGCGAGPPQESLAVALADPAATLAFAAEVRVDPTDVQSLAVRQHIPLGRRGSRREREQDRRDSDHSPRVTPPPLLVPPPDDRRRPRWWCPRRVATSSGPL